MKILFSLSVVVGMLLSSCTTSFITSSWKAPEATPKAYNKILVLGLIGDPDRSIREKMEEHLAGDLNDLGYNAFTATSVYGPKTFEGINEKEAIQLLKDKGFDAVMTIVLLDKKKEKYYIPGRINYSPYGIQHIRFWGYYSAMNSRIYTPGYYTEPGYYTDDTRYFWESNLFDMSTGTMAYSAQSQSFDPETVQKMGHEYGLMIVKDLAKNQLVSKQTPKTLKSF